MTTTPLPAAIPALSRKAPARRGVPQNARAGARAYRAIRCTLLALTLPLVIGAPVTAGPLASVAPFDVCSLLSGVEAISISNDPKVAMHGGPPGFTCAWSSPGGEYGISHDIVIFFFTEPMIRRIAKGGLSGLDPSIAAAFQTGSPLSVFQSMRKTGQSCLNYSGNLPCAEIKERVALYKHASGYDYVVLIFAQRNEGHGDAGIVRLTFDAVRVANMITPRLP